jgi:hypothetical protein
MQVLSISHKMADYFAFPLLLLLCEFHFITPRRGIIVIKAAVEMQNNLPFCD